MNKLPIKIDLPNGFLNAEIRDEYNVTEKTKKIWAVELDLLSELLRVCKEHDIKCSLAYGSLLGAVRHKGFIPWDDDLDVMFERQEYEKLLAVGPAEFKHPYFFQYALSDRKKFSPLARLRNSLTTGYVTNDPTEDYNNGIYLDLYAFDANPRNRICYLWKHFLKRVVGKCMNFYYDDRPRDASVSERVMRLVRPFARMVSYERWWHVYSGILSMYNRSESRRSHIFEASMETQISWINRDDMFDIFWATYEFLKVPVVKNYHDVLTREYGDYLQYPPVSERGAWHDGLVCFEPDIPYDEFLKKRAE